MGTVTQLAYVGLTVPDLQDFESFASATLGMVVDRRPDGELALRMDERSARMFVVGGDAGALSHIGWEVGGPVQLATLFDQLTVAGFDPHWDPGLAPRRGMADLFSCLDPAGTRLEFGWGPWSIMAPAPESPVGTPFVTGALGLGHVVLQRRQAREVRDFYLHHLGFRLTDRLFDQDGLTFLGCNARHHSVAIAEVGGPDRLLHIMVQVTSIDVLGHLFDEAVDSGVTMSTIGLHPNDRATSFYVETPAGFEVEIGWNPLTVDDASWSVTTVDRASAWGHRRIQRTPEGRALIGPPRVPPRVPGSTKSSSSDES